MKTCERFARIQSSYERDITYLRSHSERHAGTAASKTSAQTAQAEKTRMARHLARHFDRCPLCG